VHNNTATSHCFIVFVIQHAIREIKAGVWKSRCRIFR